MFCFFLPNALLFMKQKYLYRGVLENSFTERFRKISWKTPLQESFLDNATLLENDSILSVYLFILLKSILSSALCEFFRTPSGRLPLQML